MKANQIVTPFGRAAFPRLDRPDTKFNPLGNYSVKLLLEPGPETDAFLADLDRRMEASYQEELARQRAEKPKLADIKRADPPYRHQKDKDTGEELPGWEINFYAKAAYKPSEEEPKIDLPRPIVVGKDAKTPISGRVGSGSTLRVSATVRAYYTPKDGAGIGFTLQGVQVDKLIQPGQVEDLGFGALQDDSAPAETVSEVLQPPAASGVPNF